MAPRRPAMFPPLKLTPGGRARLAVAILVLLGAGSLSLYQATRSAGPGIAQAETALAETVPAASDGAPTRPESPPPPVVLPAAVADLSGGEPMEGEPMEEASPRPAVAAPPSPVATPAPAAPAAETTVAELAPPDCDVDDWQSAVKVFAPQPEYPEEARAAGLAGTVVVEASIDPTGTVSATKVLRGAAPELDRAALDAVALWRFEPARRGGEPVADTYRVAIRFDLATPPEARPEPAAAPVAGDFEPPVKLYGPPPRYPQADWVAAIEGDVVLAAAIDERGRVAGVDVVQSLSPGLDGAAVEALGKWRFRPATRGGEPVAARHVLTFRFAR